MARPQLRDGRETYELKIPTGKAGQWVRRTLDTPDPLTAGHMADMVDHFIAAHANDMLSLLLSSALSVPDLYRHWKATPLANHRGEPVPPSDEARLLHVRFVLKAVRLDSVLLEWVDQGANDKYVTQVRTFIPEGSPMLSSDFTYERVKAWLIGLTCGPNTKLRYRSALIQFAAQLLERHLITGNFVRDIKLKKSDKGTKALVRNSLSMDEAKLIVEATTQPEQRAMEALMAGSAMEWSACDNLYRRDIDVERRIVHAKGTKTEYRDRWVEVTEDWAWEIVHEYVKRMTPATKVFEKRGVAALRMHKDTCADLGLRETTLHQYRHTFAVTWIKRGATGGLREDGRDKQWLKNQLGHGENSVLVDTVYGPYMNAAKLSTQQERRLGLAPPAGPQLHAMK